MPAGNSSFGTARKLGAARAKEFALVSSYKLGYRNREDVTNLPPGVLIVGSQNIQTNVSDRIQIRKGYSVDGTQSSVNAAVLSSFDWTTNSLGERNMRACLLTSAGNDGKLQYRYVNSSGTVSWYDLLTGLTSTSFNFCTFWNETEVLRESLFVNGASQIQAWNGAITTYSSSGASTITKQGTATWGGSGFYSQVFATIGDGTTQFDITNPSGTTFRYTWDGTGTDPAITAISVPVGTYILLEAQNFSAVNKGIFTVTGSGANYFEVTNATGLAENNKTIGTGFIYTKYTKVIIINGITYAYTGGEGTTTLTGVTPSPSGISVGDVITQAVITTPNIAISADSNFSTFANGVIANLNNQIYLGALNNAKYYISKVSNYKDYTFSSPRQLGEGWHAILDANVVGFMPQENFVYITAGKNHWYNISFQSETIDTGGTAITYEQVNSLPLKTGVQQGAQSQAMLSHMKDNIIMVSNEPTIDMLGRIENYFGTPMTVNISDPIKLDVDSYDFTDGSIFYFQYNIYVAVPKEGLVLVYSLATKSWDSPQTLPISRFYIVDGELYGHSYNSSESYKLFTGYADRVYTGFQGSPIDAKAKFSYQNYGSRHALKNANSFYIEGYINANTTLKCTITYELDGCASTRTFDVDGSDSSIVCLPPQGDSLGKQSLGKVKLGGDSINSIQGLPPKFRVEKTFNNNNFFECSFSFEILGVDQAFQLLAFGLKYGFAPEIPTYIRQ